MRAILQPLMTVALATVTALAAGLAGPARAAAERAISLFNIHTDESITIVFKRDGQYVAEALERLNVFLRDYRQNEPTKMDPELFDILWEVHKELKSQRPIHVVSGYRSPKTNEMLRQTRGGQAKRSQHMLGHAMDVHFPDVPVRQLRYSALIRQRGGVGYYPTSSIPFVHIDTARVRHWPRMGRDELALLFPNGRTEHVPTDGRPLTPEDAIAARRSSPDLAVQVAAYFDLRRQRSYSPWSTSTQVASAAPAPTRQAAPRLVAAAMPMPPIPRSEPAPRLVSPPQVAAVSTGEGPSSQRMLQHLASLNNRDGDARSADRQSLTQLAALASVDSGSVTDSGGRPAGYGSAAASALTELARKIMGNEKPSSGEKSRAAEKAGAADTVWASAPEFDEEHADALSYSPFPVSPYLTVTASIDDDALVVLRHPDVEQTIAMLDEAGQQPMVRFLPDAITRLSHTELSFTGSAISESHHLVAAPERDTAQSRKLASN